MLGEGLTECWGRGLPSVGGRGLSSVGGGAYRVHEGQKSRRMVLTMEVTPCLKVYSTMLEHKHSQIVVGDDTQTHIQENAACDDKQESQHTQEKKKYSITEHNTGKYRKIPRKIATVQVLLS